MATATTTQKTHPSPLEKALAQLGPIAAHENELRLRLQHHANVTNSFRLDAETRVTETDLLLAQEEGGPLRRELSKANRERLALEAEITRLREEARDVKHARFDAPIQSAITAL